MALTIRANSLLVKRYLAVKDTGIIFLETAGIGGRRKFDFGQIDCVLMSPENMLSFQVGQEVFQIRTNPRKARHQQAIQQLVQSVASSQQRSGGFPVTRRAGSQ